MVFMKFHMARKNVIYVVFSNAERLLKSVFKDNFC